MNIHIELVKKWIADPESVSQKELRVNRIAASAASVAAAAASVAAASSAAVTHAAYWVERYEELKEQG